MKKSMIIAILILCSCTTKKVFYEPAPIDAVLTCCFGDPHNKNNHYVIMSRVVPPLQTKDKGCTKPENLFYRITEYSNGESTVVVVCKKIASYIELETEKMERGE